MEKGDERQSHKDMQGRFGVIPLGNSLKKLTVFPGVPLFPKVKVHDILGAGMQA